MKNMPGYIQYADSQVRKGVFTNVPAASGILYEQYARNHESPILDYKTGIEVSILRILFSFFDI